MASIRTVFAAAMAIAGTAAPCWATYVDPLGENGTSASASLQSILDSRRTPAADPFSVANDQVVADSLWSISGASSTATFIVEIAGYASGNRFGLFDPSDPTRRVEIFAGADSTGAARTITIVPNGGDFDVKINDVYRATFDNASFGFYLKNAVDQTFYSNSGLNPDGSFPDSTADADSVPDAPDHMVAYLGKPAWQLNISGSLKSWDSDDAVLAWEDLLGGGDRDYNDMVVLVQNVSPPGTTTFGVPDGGTTVCLLGLALISLGVWRRHA